MTEILSLPSDADAPTRAGKTRASAVASRNRTVAAVFTGTLCAAGGAAIVGLLEFGGASAPMAITIPAVLIGSLLGGIGLLKIGSAARHIFRYGRRRTTGLALASAGVLGGLMAVWPLTALPQLLGLGGLPMWFRQAFGMSVAASFVAILLFVVAGILLPDGGVADEGGEFE